MIRLALELVALKLSIALLLIVWRRQDDGFIRWPFMVALDGLAWRPAQFVLNAAGIHDVCDDFDRDVKYVVWGWLAYLYRYLPTYIGACAGEKFENQHPAYFLWSIGARRWRIGWMPKRRSPTYGGRWGALVISGRGPGRSLAL